MAHWSKQRSWQAGYNVLAIMLYPNPDEVQARQEFSAVLQHELIGRLWPAVEFLGLTLSAQDFYTLALTAKQRAFVWEYCIDWNATQAAIRAGYSA